VPNAVVIDSGPCIALFDRDDDYHETAVQFIQRQRAPLLSTVAVVTEVMYMLDFSLQAQVDFLSWVRSGAIGLIEPENADFGRVIQLMKKYSDLPMDFTDGLLVAVCERLGVNQVATIDNDFTIYRYKGRGKFVNAFFE
jgi:predicted nucleic acid-binding protein